MASVLVAVADRAPGGGHMQQTPFGRFQLLDLQKSHGGVDSWRAYDPAAGRMVAVKVLPAVSYSNTDALQRWYRDARSAADLRHPGIVAMLEAGEAGGRPFLTLPWLEGGDLGALVAGGPLTPERAVTVIEQVAPALDAAHRAGLVHRGVTPSNILLGADGVARVTDFGSAPDTDLAGAESIGTWAYLAPETILRGEADPRADVYALAGVLHFCLTGRQPFPGDGVESQIAAHLSAPPPSPTATLPGLPAALDAVVATGMAKDPGRRYASAGDLARAARAAIGSGVPAPEPNPGQPAAAPATPLTPAEPAASGAPGAPVAPVAKHRRADQPPTPPTRSRRRLFVGIAAAAVAVLVVVGVVLVSGGNDEGAFDGVYAAQFGPATLLDGTTPTDTYFAPIEATLAVRSTCPASDCVAIATTTGDSVTDAAGAEGPAVTDEFVFDTVHDTWVSATVSAGEDGDPEQWRVLSLRPGPDGTFTGDYRYLRPGRNGAMRTVTLARTGDAGDTQDSGDPARLAPRTPAPAMSLRGQYTWTRTLVNVTAGEVDDPVEVIRGLDAFTTCLRDEANRCFSLLSNDDTRLSLSYGDGGWNHTRERNVECGFRDVTRVRTEIRFPLPAGAPDPLALLEGRGREEHRGDCELSADAEVRLERTGD